MAEPDWPQMIYNTVMRFACWITNAKDTRLD